MSKKNQTSMFDRQNHKEKTSWILIHLLIPLDPDKRWFSEARTMASRLPFDMLKYYEMEWKDEIDQTNAAILESGKGSLGSLWQFYKNRWWEFKAIQEREALDRNLGAMLEVVEQRGLEPELRSIPQTLEAEMIMIEKFEKVKEKLEDYLEDCLED